MIAILLAYIAGVLTVTCTIISLSLWERVKVREKGEVFARELDRYFDLLETLLSRSTTAPKIDSRPPKGGSDFSRPQGDGK